MGYDCTDSFQTQNRRLWFNERTIHGERRPAACLSWTTASGEIIPLSVKVQDDNGGILTIRPVEVLGKEKGLSPLSRQILYQCRAVIGITRKDFYLFYHVGGGVDGMSVWELLLPP